MRLRRSGVSIGAVAATVIALLLLAPGPSSERLEKAGHEHEASLRVAVEAVHTTLPVHFDASSSTAERVCSACLLHAPTIVRLALEFGAEAMPPVVAMNASKHRWIPSMASGRLDPSRAPPSIA